MFGRKLFSNCILWSGGHCVKRYRSCSAQHLRARFISCSTAHRKSCFTFLSNCVNIVEQFPRCTCSSGDRAAVSGTACRGFDSLQVRFQKTAVCSFSGTGRCFSASVFQFSLIRPRLWKLPRPVCLLRCNSGKPYLRESLPPQRIPR